MEGSDQLSSDSKSETSKHLACQLFHALMSDMTEDIPLPSRPCSPTPSSGSERT